MTGGESGDSMPLEDLEEAKGSMGGSQTPVSKMSNPEVPLARVYGIFAVCFLSLCSFKHSFILTFLRDRSQIFTIALGATHVRGNDSTSISLIHQT